MTLRVSCSTCTIMLIQRHRRRRRRRRVWKIIGTRKIPVEN